MVHSYERYLASKRTVEDRSLNAEVIRVLQARLPSGRLRVLEIGSGIGTMVARLATTGLVRQGHYLMTDAEPSFLAASTAWLAAWGRQYGYSIATTADGMHFSSADLDLRVSAQCVPAEVLEPMPDRPLVDLLVCNSVLDLVDVRTLLPRLLRLVQPQGLCWITTNFDGDTIFEPGHPADGMLMELYHRSMDDRVRDGKPAGDSRSGRHLFGHLRDAGAQILAAGSSDWVVYGSAGAYPHDEAYFVEHILYTIEQELVGRKDIKPGLVGEWLAERRAQLARGELVYIAHQLDFLATRSSTP